MPLTQAEIEYCRRAYRVFDKDGSGVIDAWELKAILQELGNSRTEEEVRLMIQQVDDSAKGEINFADYLKVIEQYKAKAKSPDEDTETLEAWLALGGADDMSGGIELAKVKTLAEEFELSMDERELLAVADPDGQINYKNFKVLMANNAASV